MGGIGGGLYLGFMLLNKEWVKVSEKISPEAEKKKKKTKKTKNQPRAKSPRRLDDSEDEDEQDISSIIEKLAKEIKDLFEIELETFQDEREHDRRGLGICIAWGPQEVSIEKMEEHMEKVDMLEEIGEEYGLGKPRFHMVDVECH